MKHSEVHGATHDAAVEIAPVFELLFRLCIVVKHCCGAMDVAVVVRRAFPLCTLCLNSKP